MRNASLKALLLLFCVIFLVSGSISSVYALPSFTVRSGHPRLFITPDNIATLRNRAATVSADTYGYLKNWADSNWDDASDRRDLFGGDCKYDAGVLRYALIYALGQVPGFDYSTHSVNDYGDKAVETLLDMVNSDVWGWENYVPMAIAYDWVNARMTTTQKQAVVNWFISKAGTTPKLGDRYGYRFVRTPDSFYMGLAFYGDGINDAQAQVYVDFIDDYLESMKEINHQAGEDGGHSAGLCYGKYTYGTCYHIGQDLYALVTATSLTIDDTFNTYTYMSGFPTWLLYGTQSGPPSPAAYPTNDVVTLTKWEDCGSWLWNIQKTDSLVMQTLRLMSHVAKEQGDDTKARWITWLINERFQAPKQDSTWDIIFNDRNTPAVSPENLGVPKIKAFGWDESQGEIDSYLDNPKAGLGHVYMKSSWDPGSDTTHAMFKAFPYYYFGHQHFDSLAFSIFKGEPLALPNTGGYYYKFEGSRPDSDSPSTDPLGGSVGFPHQWYYYERTVSTNSLLIMDPGEVIYISDPFYQSDPFFKDGGQRGLPDGTPWWGVVTEGSMYDWGGLIRHEDAADYTYSAADATKGYNSIVDGVEYLSDHGRGTATPKVSLVQRDFVFLKSSDGNEDYFVVFDRIDSTDPTFRKVFLLHTIGEPELNGAETQTYGGANGGLFESTNTDSFKITQTTAKLFMKTLLPQNTKVYKFGGTGTSTTTAYIDDTTGTAFQGPKIDIPVASTAEFPDKPIVTINDEEAFMCDGKTSTQLTGCIRGHRYFKQNHMFDTNPYIPSHNSGSQVKQYYAWMFREAGTEDWISHPYYYGAINYDSLMVKDCDEYGRWGLRIETVDNEIHTNFLHVLHPTVNMARQQMADTELIESSNIAGVLIKAPVNKILMFTKTKDLQTSASYTVDYTGTAKHIITGLEPGWYKIYKNGQYLKTAQASIQSVLTFESSAGSTFTLEKEGEVQCVMNDIEFYPTPDIPRPARGVTIIEPTFFTPITRITDSSTDLPGSSDNYAQPGYPKHNIENADGTMLIIQSYLSPNCWHVWNANPPYNKIRDIPIPWGYGCNQNGDNDARWNNDDPNILYFIAGPELYKYNVASDTVTVIHDFSDDYPGQTITRISMGEEGDASDDRRYWAFAVQGPSFSTVALVCFEYNKITNTGQIISQLDPTDPIYEGWNSVGMSPSGKYIVVGGPPSYVYPRDFSSLRTIQTHGHFDVAIDDEGREVLVWVGHYYGPDGYTDHGYWLEMVDIETGEEQWLAPFSSTALFHVSGNSHNKPGWAVVSSYNPTDCSEPYQWSDASIMIYELTRRISKPTWGSHARVWRVAHTHMCRKGYADNPFAKLNLDGTKIFFGSGWDTSVYDGKASGAQYDVYQIDIPQECYEYFPEPTNCASQGGDCISLPCCTNLYCDASYTCQTCRSSEVGYCTGGRDEDCDGSVDCNDPDCSADPNCIGCSHLGESCSVASCCSGLYCDASQTCQNCLSSEAGRCTGGINEDCDGQTDCSDPDCYPDPNCCKQSGEGCTTGQCCSGLICETVSGGIPTATASANPTSGTAPRTVYFTGSGTDSDGSIVSYRWSYGDSFTSSSQSPGHTYSKSGNYKAVLTVTDNSGFRGSDYIDIQLTGGTNSIPTATASADVVSGPAPLTVHFTGSGSDSDGTITYYYWDFGFGYSSASQNPTKTYTEPGNYIATLSVWDNEDSVASDIVNIVVTGESAVCIEGCHRADINCDGCIIIQELMDFLYRWKVSSKDVSMPELMEAIGRWKSGAGC